MSDELLEKLGGTKILFGLVAQGHIPTIEKMLKENKLWEQIADELGWVKEAVMRSYIEYLQYKNAEYERLLIRYRNADWTSTAYDL